MPRRRSSNAVFCVFLSYAHQDRKIKDSIRSELISNGVSVWDDGLIRPGDDWQSMINRYIAETEATVVLVTKNSMKSDAVWHEIRLARSLHKPLYLVIAGTIDPATLPDELRAIQYADFRARKLSEQKRILIMQQLANTIKQNHGC